MTHVMLYLPQTKGNGGHDNLRIVSHPTAMNGFFLCYGDITVISLRVTEQRTTTLDRLKDLLGPAIFR